MIFLCHLHGLNLAWFVPSASVFTPFSPFWFCRRQSSLLPSALWCFAVGSLQLSRRGIFPCFSTPFTETFTACVWFSLITVQSYDFFLRYASICGFFFDYFQNFSICYSATVLQFDIVVLMTSKIVLYLYIYKYKVLFWLFTYWILNCSTVAL